MKKFFALLSMLVLSVGMSFAQTTYPTNPNPTGKQTTPFDSVQFSATFNADVQITELTPNDNRTSTYRDYTSFANGINQGVEVRFLNPGLTMNVDYTSSDFYAAQAAKVNGYTVQAEHTSNGTWDGPYTYNYSTYTKDGVTFAVRERFIIHANNEAVFIYQIAPVSLDTKEQWMDFEYSLRIK